MDFRFLTLISGLPIRESLARRKQKNHINPLRFYSERLMNNSLIDKNREFGDGMLHRGNLKKSVLSMLERELPS